MLNTVINPGGNPGTNDCIKNKSTEYKTILNKHFWTLTVNYSARKTFFDNRLTKGATRTDAQYFNKLSRQLKNKWNRSGY
jgi:hypothetical protein